MKAKSFDAGVCDSLAFFTLRSATGGADFFVYAVVPEFVETFRAMIAQESPPFGYILARMVPQEVTIVRVGNPGISFVAVHYAGAWRGCLNGATTMPEFPPHLAD